ncbi:uncharacterized protein LOC129761014 [Uranotaenia lowii]|uniref:uncharacterized protein LOC129761014 n=1 Tax=Uranotaenia lowii TaxID=190385 RepID=UPI00247ADB03|nr:uncharacterized protein LOC129761014 [Uranotaenia lowii]
MASVDSNGSDLTIMDSIQKAEENNIVEEKIISPTGSSGSKQQTGAVPKPKKVNKSVKILEKAVHKQKRNPVRRVRKRNDHHCKACDERDTSRMVMCDSCSAWYHFTCAEVSSNVADEPSWSCAACIAKKNPQNAERCDKGSTAQQKTTAKEFGNASEKKEKPKSARSETSRGSGLSGSRRVTELRLQKLKEMTRLKEQYLEQKYAILEDLESEAASVASEIDTSEIDRESDIQKWLEKADLLGSNNALAEELVENMPHHHEKLSQPFRHLRSNVAPKGKAMEQGLVLPNQLRRERREVLPRPKEFAPGQRSTPLAGASRSNHQQTENEVEDICILNRSQIRARQAVSKELPEFSGNPEDWPLFLATFNSSTHMCGFSNEENMLRLRKSLTGKALDAVRSRLLHPTNVSGVISTLKMLFGKPESIIHSIIMKVRSLPSPTIEKLDTLVTFAITVENLCATIQACEIPDFAFDASLRYELVNKLPSILQLAWAQHARAHSNPSLVEYSTWLYSLAEDASTVIFANPANMKSRKNAGYVNFHEMEEDPEEDLPVATVLYHQDSVESHGCTICAGNCSALENCQKFKALRLNQRWDAIKQKNLCRKCLNRHNGSCRQQKQCGVNGCNYLHHPLLHNNKAKRPPHSTNDSNVVEGSCNINQSPGNEVLFRILPIMLYGPTKTVSTYAFIDDGSELTLLEDNLVDELELDGPRQPLCLKWTSGTQRMENRSRKINLEISGKYDAAKRYRIGNIRTVKSLQVRPQTLNMQQMRKSFKHLRNVPVHSYENVSPRLIIGLEHAHLGNPLKSREGKLQDPIASKTRLGWTVYGNCTDETSPTHHMYHHTCHACSCNASSDSNLHIAMKDFFAIESMGICKPDKPFSSQEDQQALTLLSNTTQRKNGRYEASLLWKYSEIRVPDSKKMAMNRWNCLEKRLLKDPALYGTMQRTMNDYIQKGYARELTQEELNVKRDRTWYLPIFPVTNPNKPNKTRLVWDAAATSHGISLNSMLLKGPDQLASLISVLLKFREFKVGISGDIREMYHQILIRESDQHCQRFFWSDELGVPPRTYVMQVMTFGARSSPSTAQYVKNTHAQQFKQTHPAAVSAIIEKHYVDDMLISTETVEEGISLASEVKSIHASAGFELRNFVSNSRKVVTTLEQLNPPETCDEKNMNIGIAATTEKVLGMWWNTANDSFMFKISPRFDEDLLEGRRKPTKREVLRTLMLIFDPLGLVGHFLMFLKCLLQEIWRTSIGWDDPIGDEQFQKWTRWLNVLPQITTLKIPRCYRAVVSLSPDTNVQLHTLVDASENGMAAVVYLRFEKNGNIDCTITCSKTRVSPLKFLSIPRSELQSSLIGARLAKTVCENISFKVDQRFFWTDSRNVLSWMSADHRRYSQFVSHRVSEILELSELSEWHWIPSKLNVADEGTKWKKNPDLSSTCRWFQGPPFLRLPSSQWPLPEEPIEQTEIELRAHLLCHAASPDKSVIPTQKFSSWNKLLRCTSFIFRYISNLNSCRLNRKSSTGHLTDAELRASCTTGPLTKAELQRSEIYLFRYAQEVYKHEIEILSNHKVGILERNIPKNSPLHKLNPFLDDNLLLRVSGRTLACEFASFDVSNPIILPRSDHITTLIVRYFHVRYHHQNHQTVVNELRQRYHIGGLKALYKTVRKNCQMCKNDSATPQPPLMSDLPLCRLAAFNRPFSYIGIDYFGPMIIKNGRKQEKRWGVLATCLTIRAVHLQLVRSLTTDSCILAIRNIMCRRGVPITIYSDRGTNFIGADKELKRTLENVNQDRLMEEFVTSETQWSFNPPASPHMGGAWERLVRSVKTNLAKLKPNHAPTEEILENMLIEIENVINSRPLTYVPTDDDSSPVLTPNHFILGSSNGLKPFVPFDDSALALKKGWQLSQLMANVFWKMWVHDYLPTLTRRSKWFSEVKPIEVGDITVIVDPNLPRNCWPKGRVIRTIASPDGRTRKAVVQTISGIYERPVAKLAVLDVGDTDRVRENLRLPYTTGGTVDNANQINEPLALSSRNVKAKSGSSSLASVKPDKTTGRLEE